MMRITNNVLVNNLKNNLSRNIRNLEQLQNQLASGRRISRPSQDPTGIVESMRLASRLNENKVFQENAKDATGWLETTDEALGSLNTALQRAYELTVQGSNGALADEDRQAVCAEIKEIIEEVGIIANSRYSDRFLFGGTNTMQPTYEAGTFHHNQESIKFQVGIGVEVPVNLTAEEVFVEKDIMGTLQNIADHLTSGDTDALKNTDIAAINAAIDHVLSCRAKVGASVNRMEMTLSRLEEQELNFQTLQAEVDGVDPALLIMELKNQENAYRASLSVGARVIMPTLVDFLR